MSKDESGGKDNLTEAKEAAYLRAFEALNTNIGREAANHFIAYKGLFPSSDILGGMYGVCLGVAMEIEERDISERLYDKVGFLEED